MSAQLKSTNMKDSVVSPTKAKQGEMLRHLHGKEWLVPFVRNPAGLEAYRSGMIIVSEKNHNYQHAFICYKLPNWYIVVFVSDKCFHDWHPGQAFMRAYLNCLNAAHPQTKVNPVEFQLTDHVIRNLSIHNNNMFVC